MLDWKLRKGVLNGQKVLHARADYQDDLSRCISFFGH